MYLWNSKKGYEGLKLATHNALAGPAVHGQLVYPLNMTRNEEEAYSEETLGTLAAEVDTLKPPKQH